MCGLTAPIPSGALHSIGPGRFTAQNRSPEVCLSKKCLHFLQNTNAQAHLLPEAEATQERTREAVRCSAWLDAAGACLPLWRWEPECSHHPRQGDPELGQLYGTYLD
jgi:hypothetical protein